MKRLNLKAFFAHFLHSRHFGRHFRRFALPSAEQQRQGSRALAPNTAQALLQAAHSTPADVLLHLDSQMPGLSEAQAASVLARVGNNAVQYEQALPWWQHLWHCYRNPFNVLLSLLALVSLWTDDIKGASVIGAMVLLSTLLRFWQEAKSNQAADALKAMVRNTATVWRSSADTPAAQQELPIELLVPGDILALSAGDMIPADCRVLTAKDLFVAQAAMTGESLPIEKFAQQRDASILNPLDLDNILFMGTNVVSGSASAVVLHTGGNTLFGALASRVSAQDNGPTAFQAGVNQVSWLLIRFMLVMVPLVFLINGLGKGSWMQALLFALSVAVGLTPEMLPMIITSTLAKGAIFLSRKKVIVKRLDAIQNFGAMDVLCTDKTGTLTQDKIFLARHLNAWGEDSDEVLELAYLNSYYQTGLKNLLDVAVLEHAELARELEPAKNFRKVDEIPFDFTRRRMSVVVAQQGGGHLLITKGAVEEVLAVCSQVRHGQEVLALDAALLARIRQLTDTLNTEGLRVVAVAAKECPPQQQVFSLGDEADLSLVGYVAFLDPPKESTAAALGALAAHGVEVKILTGDNALVTAKICREVGLPDEGVLLGQDIEAMDEQALAQVVETHRIFAKLTPAHKERIVQQLRQNGHVVGFMGDGINDAPALRAADIGISVDTAVDIAKEAADIILLEKSLMVLEAGVLEGRRTFANMLKYIKMTASSNFGNVFSVLIASATLPFLPMLPMHLLVQNLLYDISQIATPFDHVDPELVEKPQRWQPADIGRFMVFFGPLSSVFDVLTFAMMWWVFGAQSPAQQTLFQSGWFIVGLLTQALIVHMIRTAKVPFIQSRAAPAVMAMTVAIVAIEIFIPMGPWAHYFKLQALPPLYFVFLPLIVLAYMALVQAVKHFYIRRWGWQ